MKNFSFRSPGRAKTKARTQLKGRTVDSVALAEVNQLIADLPMQRDLLIEYLHRLQDHYGALSKPHLTALAEHTRLSMAEVYEAASFYHAFEIVETLTDAHRGPVIKVCESLVCEMHGADELAAALRNGASRAADNNIRIKRVACLGRCAQAPACLVNGRASKETDAASLLRFCHEEAPESEIAGAVSFAQYRVGGGYQLLSAIREGKQSADHVIEQLTAAGLRGLGGAGFPTGQKWRFLRAVEGTCYLAINADESEPGTFKDRHYLETDPHRFIEGLLIAAEIINATSVYIYLRDEYGHLHHSLKNELQVLREANIALPPLFLRRGAGAYICGEESAMLESLEGKRGLPRHKPPFPSEVGLFGKPTLINNVETLYWVRDAIDAGADWMAGSGRRGGRGLRSFSVSGRVRDPGVKLAPAGITVTELIEEYCDGMADGHDFSAYLPGGASGGLFPASMADLPLDFGTLEEHGGLIGSAAVIVLSQHDDIAAIVKNLTKFFEHESCGQCTPCRVGTEKAAALMENDHWDQNLLGELAQVMADASICGLGQAASNPIRCALKHFSGQLP